jgi:hypothetical protein
MSWGSWFTLEHRFTGEGDHTLLVTYSASFGRRCNKKKQTSVRDFSTSPATSLAVRNSEYIVAKLIAKIKRKWLVRQKLSVDYQKTTKKTNLITPPHTGFPQSLEDETMIDLLESCPL